MTARWITADVFDGLAVLEDGSVDLVVTSPPFLALRSYLPADHPDKSKEIGSEATPAEFIDTLLAVTAELRRVLAPHGSICVELGDTYAGSGGAGGDYATNGWRENQPEFEGSGRLARYNDGRGNPDGMRDPTFSGANTLTGGGSGWPLAKSRALIPQLYEIALAYGINPLTGQPSPAGQWRVRNVVTWARPNPPVGALGDKWRPATSDLIVACTSSKRYWDDLATRKPWQEGSHSGTGGIKAAGVGGGRTEEDAERWQRNLAIKRETSGAPLLDYWEIPPGGYQGAHYAVFPPELVVPCVKAMCPEKVCRACGEPSRRIVEKSAEYAAYRDGVVDTGDYNAIARTQGFQANRQGLESASYETIGWTDCGHDDYRPGHVLDCFAGSGTTGVVATGHGHDVTLIDLDERNADLARERIGPLMFDGPIYPTRPQQSEPAASLQTRDGAQ